LAVIAVYDIADVCQLEGKEQKLIAEPLGAMSVEPLEVGAGRQLKRHRN